MPPQDIRNLSFEELTAYLKENQIKPFRARQIFEWLYQKGVEDFEAMLNLPSDLREKMKKYFSMTPLALAEQLLSRDGTRKFLFFLDDGEKVEAALLPFEKRVAMCVSSQAGCKFGCRFCASGLGGWKRNLTSSEILSQILFARRSCEEPLSHIVFMGTGEPLDNYTNVLRAVRIINSPLGMNIAARRITISTCGLIPQIERLVQEKLQIELAVSLHGFDDASRNTLMPIAKSYPIKDLIAACRQYSKATKRQVTFEYILLEKITCTEEAARQLGRLLKGMLCKINLILYNEVPEFAYTCPSMEEAMTFKKLLMGQGIRTTIRMSKGDDIKAACGQLRHLSK